MFTVKNKIYFLIPLLAVLSLFVYLYQDRNQLEVIDKTGEDKLDNTTTTPNIGVGGTGDFTVTPLSEGKIDIKEPSLDREIVIPNYFSKEASEIVKNKINEVVSNLRSGQSTSENWLKLGVYRKQIDDYEGARQIWEYVATVWPDSYIAFSNLGDIYHYYIKDYVKAETNMLRALQLEPKVLSNYRNLFDLYALSYTEKKDKADDVLIEAIKKNPDKIDIMILLARFYKDNGQKESSREYYEKAVESAKSQGLLNVVEDISKEMDQLGQ